MEKQIIVKEKQEFFVPEGNGARAVSEAEYKKYSKELLEALDLIRTIKYPGQEDDVVGLSFLHDFRFRDYEGKNFLVNYLGDGEGVRYRIMKEFFILIIILR